MTEVNPAGADALPRPGSVADPKPEAGHGRSSGGTDATSLSSSVGLGEASPSTEGAEAGRRRRPRRRRRRSGSGGGAEAAAALAAASEGEPPRAPERAAGGAPAPEATAAPGSDGEAAPLPGFPAGREGEPGERRRRRRSRRRGRRTAGETPAAEDDTAREAIPEEPPGKEPEAGPAPAAGTSPPEAPARRKRRRRRGGRGRARAEAGPVGVESIPGEEDELDPVETSAEELPDLPEEAQRIHPGPEAAPARGRRRERRPRREREKQDAERPLAPARPAKPNVILVNAADREETRVAVVEEEAIVDFQMTVKRHKSLVNDIYRGRVVNLEPAIGAAFIDFGQGRNGFLHTSDVLSAYGSEDWSLDKLLTTKVDPEEWDAESSQPDVALELPEEGGERPEGGARKGGERRRGRDVRRRARPRLPITDLLDKGQSVVVQVTKDAIGDKGPTLTTYISIPGRYLVLMPSMARTGVSRKIEDEKERRRLKRILEGLDVPAGMGVIVRTAGIGCTKADLKRDFDYLMLLWESFGKRLTLGRGPAPLYEESDVAIRTIRDLFTDQTEAVEVDDPKVFERVREFTERLMPENIERVKLHEGARPLFHAYNVEQDFERMFARRIDLPSGGSIVFDQTEALVAIDVNSGKTRSDGFDFEDIALRTNLDAVAEIARQIRLRDLGGIIVCDFIDMQKSSSRRAVERALRDALALDRARSKLGRISQFGLLEMTRQRLGPGLSKMLFQNCPRCRGSGRLRTVESRAGAILRRLGSALALKGFSKVEVRAAPEVIDFLERNDSAELSLLEQRHERELTLVAVPDQVEDCVLRYLRADGREVRPGGRRKR